MVTEHNPDNEFREEFPIQQVDALKLTAEDIESLAKSAKKSRVVMLPMVVESEDEEHRIWRRI